MPLDYTTVGVQELAMTWDLQTGNLVTRVDYDKGIGEVFTFDNLDRLTSSTASNQPTVSMNYAPSGTYTGNLTMKSDAGTISYHPQKIHAVTTVTDPQNLIPSFQQDISYNSFQDPVSITEDGKVLSFTYAADGSRRKSSLTDNGVNTQTRLYLGACELDVNNNQWVHYISGGDGLCTIVTKDNSSTDYYYTYTDHLGSILTLTDDQGNIFAEQSFDAWGRKRNPNTWGFSGIPSVPNWLYRGYTGHEHLPEFGLIHMNGRMYDPILGRMLSPDNYVHGSLGTQGFNRYSYAGNNPLKYTDPSGEIVMAPIVTAMIVGGMINLGVNMAAGNVNSTQDVITAFGIGALAGGLGGLAGAGVGSLVTGAKFSSLLLGSVSTTGFIASGAQVGANSFTNTFFMDAANNYLLKGNSLSASLSSGLKSGLINGGIGFGIGGLMGGIHAARTGRNFWTGDYPTVSLGELAVSHPNPEEIYVANRSSKDVYYMAEDGHVGLSNRLGPGEGLRDPVDALATMKYQDRIFKVPGKEIDWILTPPQDGTFPPLEGVPVNIRIGHPKVTILPDGDISLEHSIGDLLFVIGNRAGNSNYTYGWLTQPQTRTTYFDGLFELARIIGQ